MGIRINKKLTAAMNSCVSPIFVKVGGSLKFIGTGFRINTKGTMLTAAHVVKDIIEKSGMVIKDNKIRKEKKIHAYALNIETERLIRISNMNYDSASDVGVLLLADDENSVNSLRLLLSIASPKIDETVILYGFHKVTSDIKVDEDGRILSGEIKEYKTAFSNGVVKEVYTLYRDESLLRFPSFRTNVRSEHTMSGGPIINEAGYVCGVLSSGYDKESGFDYESYGSLLYPTMHTDIMFRVGDNIKRLKMLKCMQKNIIFSDGSYKYFKEKPDGNIEIDFEKLNMECPTSENWNKYMSEVYNKMEFGIEH